MGVLLAGSSADHAQLPPLALVLGSPAIAGRIARDLRAEGFKTTSLSELSVARLPAPGHPQSLLELRGVLQRFVAYGGNTHQLFIHPGVSDWAERPELGLVGQELGIHVICPAARVISLFANKLTLLAEADRIGIPTPVLSFDPIQSARELQNVLRAIGASAAAGTPGMRSFPIVLKSVRGRAVQNVCALQGPEDLETTLPLWLEQLRANLGEAVFFAERYIEDARLVTQPFVRFGDGRIEFFPASDASLQIRGRKSVEFCPPSEMDSGPLMQLQQWSTRLAEHLSFVGLGTFEFLVDGPRVFLLNGLARLNSGFHLWENVAGVSAIRQQLSALGLIEGASSRSTSRNTKRGPSAGIAVRIHAENSLLHLPQPGVVREISEKREWSFPSASAELDLNVAPGDDLSGASREREESGLVGILWVGGAERKQALTLARGILLEEIWIAGSLQTNQRFLAELLSHPWVRSGMFHAAFIDEEFIPDMRVPQDIQEEAARVCASLGSEPLDSRWIAGDQRVKPASGTPHWVEVPKIFSAAHGRGISGTLQVTDGRRLRACAYPVQAALGQKWLVRIGGWTLQLRKLLPRPNGARSHKLLSLVTGRIYSVLFRQGAHVPAHEPVMVVEALGVLVPHALPVDVCIRDWKALTGDEVEAGQELAELEMLSNPSS